MKILLVEDEPKVAAFISKGLQEHSYSITLAEDGQAGYQMGLENDYDLIILDVLLPKINGLEVCRKIRQVKKDIPILMLSALDTVNDKVVGLENGADDYLTKPFHFSELLARIKAICRRNDVAIPGTIHRVDDLVMDCDKKIVTRNGKVILLSSKEFVLLEVLMANKNQILSRTRIAEAVWGISFNRGTNLIDVYINYLRAKIDKGYTKHLIHTVIGMGYIIKD